jgi:hypothetical protein
MQVAANPHDAERISVTPVHTSVSGRVRFRVVGLRDGHTLARTLERGLLAAPGVTRASASATTGNVLVLHDASSSIPELAERIGALLRGEIAVEGGSDASPYPWHSMELAEVAQVLGTSQERGLSNKEGNRRLLSDGANSIPSLRSRSDWSMFIEQFQGLPVALLAGADLGGARGVLLMQSSGTGNCVNMLSLIAGARFPFLTLISMRGEFGEGNPWQFPMGQAVVPVMTAMGVTCLRVERPEEVAPTVGAALTMAFQSGQAVAVLLTQKLIGAKKF